MRQWTANTDITTTTSCICLTGLFFWKLFWLSWVFQRRTLGHWWSSFHTPNPLPIGQPTVSKCWKVLYDQNYTRYQKLPSYICPVCVHLHEKCRLVSENNDLSYNQLVQLKAAMWLTATSSNSVNCLLIAVTVLDMLCLSVYVCVHLLGR